MHHVIWSHDAFLLRKMMNVYWHIDKSVSQRYKCAPIDEKKDLFYSMYRDMELDKRRIREQNFLLEEERRRGIRFNRISTAFTYLCSHRSVDHFSLLCLLLGILFISFKLEDLIILSWRSALMPLTILMIQTNFIFGFYYLMFCFFPQVEDVPKRSGALWWAILHIANGDRLLCAITLVCFDVSFISLIVMANQDMNGVHVAAVIGPLIVACVFFAITVLFRKTAYNSSVIMKITMFAISQLALIQLVFLLLRIEDHILWTWNLVLIPAYCLSALFVLFPIFFCLDKEIDDDIADFTPLLAIMALASITIAVPVLTFVALTAINLSSIVKRYSWTTVFVPIYITSVLLYLVYSYGDIRSQRRRARGIVL